MTSAADRTQRARELLRVVEGAEAELRELLRSDGALEVPGPLRERLECRTASDIPIRERWSATAGDGVPPEALEALDARATALQRRTDAILASIGEGVYVLDAGGRVTFANAVALEAIGGSLEEVLGKRAHEIFHHHRADGTSYPPDECPVSCTARDGVVRRVGDEVFFRADGSPFPVEYVCSPVPSEEGQGHGVVVCFRDLTATRRVEAERRELLALLEMSSKVGKMGAWSVDLPSFEHRWSEAARDIHEVAPGEQLSLEQLFDLYPPEDRRTLRDAFYRCVKERVPFDEEVRFVTARGRATWVRVIGEAVVDATGTILRVQGALQDIEALKRAESSLEVSEKRFRQLAEAMPFIVWMATPDGQVDYSNSRFFDYTGVAREAPASDRWQGCLHPDDLEPCLREWGRCVTGGSPFEIEYRIRGADGAYRWFRVQARPIRDDSGAVVKWYGTAVDVHEIKLLQGEAQRMAARWWTTLESITDAFFTVDRRWELVYVNAEAERLLGRRREELIGRCLWDELPETEEERSFRAYLKRASQGGDPALNEIQLSSGRWLEARAYPSHEGLAVYLRDVTETRRQQEALRESETRFRLLSKATNDAIWDWDLVTDEVWWNEGITNLFGVPQEELEPTSASWTKRIHPEDHDAVWRSIRGAIDGAAEGWSAEYRFDNGRGGWAYVLDRGHIIRDEGGAAIRMIGGMTDLTERKIAEEKLREQATLLEHARDAIVVRDPSHRILYWNRSAERLYGWSTAEVLGRSIKELLYEDPSQFLVATETTLERGEWVGELEHRTKDGKALIVEGHWTVIRDEGGAASSVLAINTDVTERKKLEVQFLRAQRMESIGTLAGGIAHDLNNVFAPILMTTSLLRQDEVETSKLRDLATIESCAQRGADMVRQLLLFARGSEGQRTNVDLSAVAREIEIIVRETFPKSISLRLEVEPDLWKVRGNPTQLHQVLTNLCVNARDAMGKGGVLSIRLRHVVLDDVYAGMNSEARPGPYVLIRVEDTGCGMSSEVLDRVFEPFFTTKQVGKGTGLGLSTAHSIVRSHGGFIHVYSELGKGTRFKIYLPALAPAETTERVSLEQTRLPRGDGELVLVVDDEESIRNVTKRTLERFGYRVLLASNGAEAVSAYAKNQEDVRVVLTDMTMPIMDGPATIVALKSINPRVRIIGSSGLAANGNVAKAVDAGVRYFVPKPYTADTMLRVLRAALSEPDEPERGH